MTEERFDREIYEILIELGAKPNQARYIASLPNIREMDQTSFYILASLHTDPTGRIITSTQGLGNVPFDMGSTLGDVVAYLNTETGIRWADWMWDEYQRAEREYEALLEQGVELPEDYVPDSRLHRIMYEPFAAEEQTYRGMVALGKAQREAETKFETARTEIQARDVSPEEKRGAIAQSYRDIYGATMPEYLLASVGEKPIQRPGVTIPRITGEKQEFIPSAREIYEKVRPKGEPTLERFYKGRESSIYGEYLGQVGEKATKKETISAWERFLKGYKWLQKYKELPPYQRGEDISRFKPKTRFLR